MKNILIINLHSSRNAGDAALAMTACQQLHQAFPDSTVTLSLNDPASHPDGDPKVGSFMYWFHTLSDSGRPRWQPLEMIRLGIGSLLALVTFRMIKRPVYPLLTREQTKFIEAYFSADLVASAPGNFLYSSGKIGFSFLIAIYSMAYALWAGKPLYLLPQSIGPIHHSWERWLLRQILNRARLVLVREQLSITQIRQANVTHSRLRLQPDMAFTFPASPPEEAKAWLKNCGVEINSNQPRLGITAINWGAQTGQHALQVNYESALSTAVRRFIETTGGSVIFYPQVIGTTPSADDRLPARRIIADLKLRPDQVVLVEAPPSPAILKAAYGWMELFIGTRMHSNIFALCNNVPVLAIAYRHKTQGIMHMLGLDEWTLDIQSARDTLLADKLLDLWQQRSAVRQQIQAAIPHVIEQSQQTGVIIARDFEQYQQGDR